MPQNNKTVTKALPNLGEKALVVMEPLKGGSLSLSL